MLTVFYIVQFIITALLIIVVMFQKSEGGTSLISSNSYNSFFSGSSFSSNPLTKITIILGVILFVNSIVIGSLQIAKNSKDRDLINQIEQFQKQKEATNNKDTDKKSSSKLPNVPLENNKAKAKNNEYQLPSIPLKTN